MHKLLVLGRRLYFNVTIIFVYFSLAATKILSDNIDKSNTVSIALSDFV